MPVYLHDLITTDSCIDVLGLCNCNCMYNKNEDNVITCMDDAVTVQTYLTRADRQTDQEDR